MPGLSERGPLGHCDDGAQDPEIEAMTTEDCTFSVGVIHAGQWVNCVSSSCFAEVLSMAKTDEDL